MRRTGRNKEIERHIEQHQTRRRRQAIEHTGYAAPRATTGGYNGIALCTRHHSIKHTCSGFGITQCTRGIIAHGMALALALAPEVVPSVAEGRYEGWKYTIGIRSARCHFTVL
jgi:hypothetical protein